MSESITHINIYENPDSLEIGTPSKGGAVKVYGDFKNMIGFKEKLKNAFELRKEALELMGGN